MGFLSPEDAAVVRERLAQQLAGPVVLEFFTRRSRLVVPGREPCALCKETEALLEELAALSDRLTLRVHDVDEEPEVAEAFGVFGVPAIAVVGARDYGIRFFGIPAGLEFVPLLEAIIDASTGDSRLTEASRREVAGIPGPATIKVFVTPTCPYCPGAVRLAHQLAVEHDGIRAEMVEATEFPELSRRYGVMGVPKIVVNDRAGFEGYRPERQFVALVARAAAAAAEAREAAQAEEGPGAPPGHRGPA